jgi:hypothetical protein
MRRPVYVLMVRAKPGVNDVRALRAWLKIGLRKYGMRCLEVTTKGKEKVMDARKYASKYVKPDQVRDGPIETRVVNVFEDERYGRLMLELETGSQFALNAGNTSALMKAWGHDTNGWVGQELVLELGTFKDYSADRDNPEEKETVRVRAISKTAEVQNGSAPASKPPLPPIRMVGSPKDMDDEIPF